MKSLSHTRQAGMVGTVSFERYMASTNSWYEVASFTKRRPAAFTAIRPGLARSHTRCG